MIEIFSKRTIRSKSYNLGGDKRKMVVGSGILHTPSDYAAFDRGEEVVWSDCDHRLVLDGGIYKTINTWYDIEIDPAIVGYRYTGKRGGNIDVSLATIGGDTSWTVNPPEITNEGYVLVWRDVKPGVDIELAMSPAGLDLRKIIKNASAPRVFEWLRTGTPSKQFVRSQTLARDNMGKVPRADGDPYERQVNVVSSQIGNIYREEVLTETVRIDKKTRVKSLDAEVVYPISVDADITEDIAANADDGYEYSYGSWYASGDGSNLNRVGFITGVKSGFCHAGWRFLGVAIYSTDTIDSGTQLKMRINNKSGSPTVDFYGDDVASAAVWSNSSKPSSGFTKTTATTAKTISGTPPYTGYVDMQGIITEIKGVAGFDAGNKDIRIAAFGRSGGLWFDVRDYSHGSFAQDVQLEVNYTRAGGSPTPSEFETATVTEFQAVNVKLMPKKFN